GGSATVTNQPSRVSAGGRAPSTSASPPVLANGTASEPMISTLGACGGFGARVGRSRVDEGRSRSIRRDTASILPGPLWPIGSKPTRVGANLRPLYAVQPASPTTVQSQDAGNAAAAHARGTARSRRVEAAENH